MEENNSVNISEKGYIDKEEIEKIYLASQWQLIWW